MKYLNKIDDSPLQEMTLTGIPAQKINMRLRFIPTQNSWIMDVLWNDINTYGINVCCSQNLLYFLKNIIPFGISCVTVDGQDPSTINDFNSGYAKLYLLDETDLKTLEELFFA